MLLVEYEGKKESKAHAKRHGPYRVVNHIGTVYTLENLLTNKSRDYHVKLLSQYNTDEFKTAEVVKVAKIDEDLRDVTQVINHRFKGAPWNDINSLRSFPLLSSLR